MKPVTLYTTPFCPFCLRAKALLDGKGVAYTDVDVSGRPEVRAEAAARAGMRTVPMIFIGDECIGGYDDLAALEHAGRLDEKLAA